MSNVPDTSLRTLFELNYFQLKSQVLASKLVRVLAPCCDRYYKVLLYILYKKACWDTHKVFSSYVKTTSINVVLFYPLLIG